MNNNDKKRLIKTVILVFVQSLIIVGILHSKGIQGLPPIVCWWAKAGAMFLLIVASIFLIKKIKGLFS